MSIILRDKYLVSNSNCYLSYSLAFFILYSQTLINDDAYVLHINIYVFMLYESMVYSPLIHFSLDTTFEIYINMCFALIYDPFKCL